MFLLSHLIVTAAWILNVQAGDDKIFHGWKAEPESRGTWSILWSCLATIFICTWSVLHLKVPKRHGRRYLFFRKLGWMLLATIAPEYILSIPFSSFNNARNMSIHLARQGHKEWTLTHMQFALAGGFWYRRPRGRLSKCDADQLQTMIEEECLNGPPISAEELRSRGKSDFGR